MQQTTRVRGLSRLSRKVCPISAVVTVVEERKRAKATKYGTILKSALRHIVSEDNNND